MIIPNYTKVKKINMDVNVNANVNCDYEYEKLIWILNLKNEIENGNVYKHELNIYMYVCQGGGSAQP